MRTITLDTATLAYDDVGPDRGVPLLLVHGHPFDRSMWHPQLEHFSADRRVIVPDLRGYGASPGAVPDWAAYADDLDGLLDALRIPRAVVAGLSMGGQIALELQRRHPSRVAGLLLADTTAAAEPARAARLAMADRMLAEGMDPYAVEMLYRMVTTRAPAAVADHVLAMMRGTDPAGAAAAQRARAERPDHLPRLRSVAVPTVVVVGAEDDLTPVSDARTIAGLVPDAELVVVEDAAHLPNLEQPVAFNGVMSWLLARVDRAGDRSATSND